MREIKFRAFYEGLMFSVSDMYFNKNELHQIYLTTDDALNLNTWAWVGTKDLHLMQFTGITDSNGVDIYEGDIISNLHGHDIERTVVQFNKTRFNYKYDMVVCGNQSISHIVIGNIHEDEDLYQQLTRPVDEFDSIPNHPKSTEGN